MSALAPSDLRIITKLVQILKQDHGLSLEYQDPRLPLIVREKVFDLEDPVLMALWNTLSNQFKAASIPAKEPSANDSQQIDAKKARYYRGQLVEGEEPPKKAKEAEPEPQGKGRYIVYRGKKQWVPD